MIKACLFDFDGVIADTEKYHAIALQKYLRSIFKVYLSLNELNNYAGLTGDVKVRRILKEKGLEHKISQFNIDDLINTYRNLLIKVLKPKPGFKALIYQLEKANIAIAIVSSIPHSDILTFLNNNSLTKYIDVIVGYDDVHKHKPNPEPYIHAINSLNINPSFCCAIEDSFPGLQAALNAKIRYIIHFSNAKKMNIPVHTTINSFFELREVIKKINWDK